MSDKQHQGYVRNCLLMMKSGEKVTPFCSEDGPVIASLDGYAVIPMDVLQDLMNASTVPKNILVRSMQFMPVNIEPNGAEKSKTEDPKGE